MALASPVAMLHVVAHAVFGEFLWRSYEEGLALWDRLMAMLPAALCLMPDHVHLLTDQYDRGAFAHLLSGYARWRHCHRGGPGGRVWLEHPEPRQLLAPKHLRRSFRYVMLNPCRDGLADDPLAWALSTHRDSVGLCWPPVVRPSQQPERLHGYVSADPSVQVDGTALPIRRADAGKPHWRVLVAAVSALTRTPVARLREAGPGRQLLVAAALTLGALPPQRVAALLGIGRSTLYREPPVRPELLGLVARVCGDLRFAALHDERLDRERRWRGYMESQRRRRCGTSWLFD
jgi:hypothetical protein